MKSITKMVILIAILMSCKKEKTDPKDGLYIYGEYTYYDTQSPTFTINPNETSKNITYSPAEIKDTTINGEKRIRIKIPNIRITINNIPYTLGEVQVEEKKSDGWKKQEEFKNIDISIKNKIAIAMVLDMSTSLASERDDVKSYAIKFANDFLIPSNGYLGLVLFSQNIKQYSFTVSSTTAKDRIQGYTESKNATTLYGAMYTGIQMLDTFSTKVDKKILLTFTDGGDNNTNNPTLVKNNILASNHERYIIGLRGKGGDYQETDLKSLVQKQDNFVAADDITGVDKAFNSILKSITTTSVIQYFRTEQRFTPNVDPPVKVRLKLIVK